MKNSSWLAAAVAVLAPLPALAGEAPADVAAIAKKLVAEDPAVARKAEGDLLALGWPVVRALELLKGSAAIPEADRVAFEARAAAIQFEIEDATLKTAMKEGKAAVSRLGVETEEGLERWTLVPRENPNRLLRKYLKDHVVIAGMCSWVKNGISTMREPLVMTKFAVRVGTWEALRLGKDPTPLFNAEHIAPSSAEEAMEAVELYHLLTLDERFDMESGFDKGLEAGGCFLLRKPSDVPGAEKRPVPEAVAAQIAPPSCAAVEGGYEATTYVWYRNSGRVVRRAFSFKGGSLSVKTEELAKRVGEYTLKQ